MNAFNQNDPVTAIDYLGLWTRDRWSGGWGEYTGTATACPGDSLPELAELITGNRSDSAVLALVDPVESEQKVNVAPLLIALENRMRNKVISATSSFKARFGLPVDQYNGSGAGSVNRFFFGGRQTADCYWAAKAVLAKGLLDTIGDNTFNSLGYNYNRFPTSEMTKPIATVVPGDWLYFKNYVGYPKYWAWQGENVIKVGSDLYWGYTGAGGSRSEALWYEFLKIHFTIDTQRQPTGSIGGYQGSATFIDTAKVAMEAFDLRRGKSTKTGE